MLITVSHKRTDFFSNHVRNNATSYSYNAEATTLDLEEFLGLVLSAAEEGYTREDVITRAAELIQASLPTNA